MPTVKFLINNGNDCDKLVNALFNAGYSIHKEAVPTTKGADYYVCVEVCRDAVIANEN